MSHVLDRNSPRDARRLDDSQAARRGSVRTELRLARGVAGALIAASAASLPGCSSAANPEGTVTRPVNAAETPGFAIGASEWSRGGHRDSAGVATSSPTAAPTLATSTDDAGGAATPPPTASETTSVPDPIVAVAETDETAETTRELERPPVAEAASPEVAETETTPPTTVVATPAKGADEDPVPPPPAPRSVAEASSPPIVGTRETSGGATTPAGPERPLSSDPIEAAASILAAGVRSPDPVIRANALEGMLAWPSLLREHVAGGLVDDNRGVRFVAAMCVGRAGIADLAHLVQPLLRDPSDSVRAAAIYALRRCGRPVDPSPLAAMVRSDDPEVRSNAYIVLGELGDASSAGMVRESLGRGMRRVHPIRVRVVELQAAETLVKLGSDDELEVVRAALFAPVEQGELSILACQILARIGDRSAAPMLERLVLASGTSARPPEIRMAATQALAELGSRTRVDAASVAEDAMQSPDPLLRAQGAAVAGAAGGRGAIESLWTRLSDPVEFVRITAAGNLLKATAEESSVADATRMR